METKELIIQIPEGYVIDKENSYFEKIVFKKIDTKLRSWEEYCESQKSKLAKGYFMDSDSNIHEADWKDMKNPEYWKSVLLSEKLAEAFRAMMQLISLRQSWIEDWEPNWVDNTHKWYIRLYKYHVDIDNTYGASHPLTFPTKQMAEDFKECFKELLEEAKGLY